MRKTTKLMIAMSAAVYLAIPCFGFSATDLKNILGAAAEGDPIVAVVVCKEGVRIGSVPEATRDKLFAEALAKAHSASKKLYRAKKPGAAMQRLKDMFNTISELEGKRVPESINEPYFKTWIADFKQAHLSKEQYIAPLNDYAFFLQETGNDEQAVPIFREIIDEDPAREVAYLNLADSLWRLGEPDKANQFYDRYRKLMIAHHLKQQVPSRVQEYLEAIGY